jgi:hypothetical protein
MRNAVGEKCAGEEIGEIIIPRHDAILIGSTLFPMLGLSSPDSQGVYRITPPMMSRSGL